MAGESARGVDGREPCENVPDVISVAAIEDKGDGGTGRGLKGRGGKLGEHGTNNFTFPIHTPRLRTPAIISVIHFSIHLTCKRMPDVVFIQTHLQWRRDYRELIESGAPGNGARYVAWKGYIEATYGPSNFQWEFCTLPTHFVSVIIRHGSGESLDVTDYGEDW